MFTITSKQGTIFTPDDSANKDWCNNMFNITLFIIMKIYKLKTITSE